MRGRTVAFDLDDVLCYRTSEKGKIDKYRSCVPVTSMIEVVNKCYDEGYTIVVYTARGMTGFRGNIIDIEANLYELTHNQLVDWGVKFHQLVMGKIHYDLLIDDKAVNSANIKTHQDIRGYLKE